MMTKTAYYMQMGAGSCAGRAWKAVSPGGRTGREERKTGRTGHTAEYG